MTGNFALALMVDPSVQAPVLSQPSLPFPIGKAAGTDSGLTYTAPNDDTDSPESIRALEEAPFHDGNDFIPVGHFDITRLD
jgi:hypothetical protein